MPPQPSADGELFQAEEYTDTPLLAAIEELAGQTDHTIFEFEKLSLRQIYGLAVEHYQNNLPEIWKIWADWNQPNLQQPMGDL